MRIIILAILLFFGASTHLFAQVVDEANILVLSNHKLQEYTTGGVLVQEIDIETPDYVEQAWKAPIPSRVCGAGFTAIVGHTESSGVESALKGVSAHIRSSWLDLEYSKSQLSLTKTHISCFDSGVGMFLDPVSRKVMSFNHGRRGGIYERFSVSNPDAKHLEIGLDKHVYVINVKPSAANPTFAQAISIADYNSAGGLYGSIPVDFNALPDSNLISFSLSQLKFAVTNDAVFLSYSTFKYDRPVPVSGYVVKLNRLGKVIGSLKVSNKAISDVQVRKDGTLIYSTFFSSDGTLSVGVTDTKLSKPSEFNTKPGWIPQIDFVNTWYPTDDEDGPYGY